MNQDPSYLWEEQLTVDDGDNYFYVQDDYYGHMDIHDNENGHNGQNNGRSLVSKLSYDHVAVDDKPRCNYIDGWDNSGDNLDHVITA